MLFRPASCAPYREKSPGINRRNEMVIEAQCLRLMPVVTKARTMTGDRSAVQFNQAYSQAYNPAYKQRAAARFTRRCLQPVSWAVATPALH